MRWLHLSDIHYNPGKDGRSSAQLREKLLLFLKNKKLEVDEIFITGDFRHAFFQKDENILEVAKDSVKYIKEVAKAVGVSSTDNIHIVPGNHDLTRGSNDELDNIIKSYDYDKGDFSTEELIKLLNRFDFFKLVCCELYGDNIFYDELVNNIHTYRLVQNYVLLYMNTSLTCGRSDERGNLVVDNYHLYKTLEDISKTHSDKKIIILAHHSTDCFSKKEREVIETLFNDYPVSYYLCGDSHEVWIKKINNTIELTTGCLVQEKGVENTFCICDTGTGIGKITFYNWNTKFSTWNEYQAFNDYINKVIEDKKDFISGVPLVVDKVQEYNLPNLAGNYRIEESNLKEPFNILTQNNLLYISGISGIGKTSLSIKLSEMLKENKLLKSIFFINGAQITEAKNLNSVCFESGSKINLLAMIKEGNSLFIIDDLQMGIEGIMEEFWNEISNSNNKSASYVIVNSQINSEFSKKLNIQYRQSFLTETEQVSYILNWRLPKDKKCSIETVERIKKNTNGHPLLLNSLRALVLYDNSNWEDIVEEESNDFMYHEVDNDKFISKILKRHKEVLERELYSIKWINEKNISESLLSKLITKEGIRKLVSRSFIQINNDTVKVHDIIFRCIDNGDYNEQSIKKYDSDFYNRFYSFFKSQKSKKSGVYFKALHQHENKIFELAKHKNEPSVEWYFYLQSFPNDDMNVIDNFSFEDMDMNQLVKSKDSEYIIGTVFEIVEGESRKNKDSSEYISKIQERILFLKTILAKVNSKTNLYINIEHHLGKLYRNIGELDEAREYFESVLEKNPERYETKLQLIRIYKSKEMISKEDVLKEYTNLIDEYINGKDISMSVVLAAYMEIYSYDKAGTIKKKYFLEYFEHFFKAVTSVAVETFDLPYNTLALTMKYFTYEHPEKVILFMNSIPVPSVEMINKKNYFDIAQMYKEVGKAIMWSEKNFEKENVNNYFITAENFYNLIDLKNSYRCVQRVENLILLKKYEEAITVLMDNKFENDEFWNYRIGQAMAFSSGSKYDKAMVLKYLQKAIDLCKKENFLSSFYHTKANFLAEIKDVSSASTSYQTALNKCKSEKYIKQIKEDMKKYGLL